MNRDRITSILQTLIEKLSIAHTGIEMREESGQPMFSIATEDSAVLIGKDGETLRALTYLVKKMVERESGSLEETKFFLDVNGYQTKRLEVLRNKARMLAERARLFKYDVELSPMNAYERMIIHAAFADDPEITTESHGEGKFRRVVIKYKDPHRKENKDDLAI